MRKNPNDIDLTDYSTDVMTLYIEGIFKRPHSPIQEVEAVERTE